MSMAAHPGYGGKSFRFGVFELDERSAQLRRNGHRIRLQDQPVRLLLYLIGQRGELVTREQLQKALWPEDTFVDFDHGLNTAVSKIRDALGDSPANPRFLETVPRKGYRFIAPVEEIGPDTPTPVIARKRKYAGWTAATVIGLAILAGTWTSTVPGRNRADWVGSPLTSFPGSELSPSFSPDGERIAFSWDGRTGDNYDIYVMQRGSDAVTRLTSHPAKDFQPSWSPDGRWIAFSRHLGGENFHIICMPAIGGPERTVTSFRRHHSYARLGSLAWLPGSEAIVFSDLGDREKDAASLYSVSLVTGERRQFVPPAIGAEGDVEPAVSPDGRRLAFVRRSSQATALHVAPLSPDGQLAGGPKPVFSDRKTIGRPAWTADSGELIFQFGDLHLPQLWRIRPGEAKPRPIALSGERAGMPSVAPRGARMAYAQFTTNINVMWFQAGHGRKPEGWPGSSTYLDHMAEFSPGGDRVAFMSDRAGWASVWVALPDGTQSVRLSDRHLGHNLAWMPDGEQIAASDGSSIFLLDARTGIPRKVLSPGHEPREVGVARNGKWIYFGSLESGLSQVWKASMDGLTSVRVTQNGGHHPKESPDGRELYFVKGPANSLWRVPVDGGEEQLIIPALQWGSTYDPVDGGIYFIPPPESAEPSAIRFLRFSSGKVEVVTELNKRVLSGFSVSPDRRTFLFTEAEQLTADLMLVENFR